MLSYFDRQGGELQGCTGFAEAVVMSDEAANKEERYCFEIRSPDDDQDAGCKLEAKTADDMRAWMIAIVEQQGTQAARKASASSRPGADDVDEDTTQEQSSATPNGSPVRPAPQKDPPVVLNRPWESEADYSVVDEMQRLRDDRDKLMRWILSEVSTQSPGSVEMPVDEFDRTNFEADGTMGSQLPVTHRLQFHGSCGCAGAVRLDRSNHQQTYRVFCLVCVRLSSGPGQV